MAERGEIRQLTGVQSVYEAPPSPDVRVDTDEKSVEDAVAILRELLRDRSIVNE